MLVFAASGQCQETAGNFVIAPDALSIDNSGQGLLRMKLVFSGNAGPGVTLKDLDKPASKAIEFFFLGLAFPEDKFWVNLNPGQKSKVIDPQLSGTDIGKIILASDLRLKKDIAAVTNPRTSAIGRKYWDRLYAKAEELGIEEKIPVATRVWIIPEAAFVHETGSGVEINSSSLRVCLESEYQRSGQAPAGDPAQGKLAEYADGLLRELVIPELTRKVNEDSSYAQLRAVYRVLILAQWYKKNAYASGGIMLTENYLTALTDANSELSFGAEQVYKEYLRSLRKGEYAFSEDTNGKLEFYLSVITRDYFSGGVDLRNIKTLDGPGGGGDPGRKSYAVEINLPENCARPLQYARNQAELKPEHQDGVKGTAPDWQLPGIASENLRDQPSFSRERFSRAVLSSL